MIDIYKTRISHDLQKLIDKVSYNDYLLSEKQVISLISGNTELELVMQVRNKTRIKENGRKKRHGNTK